MVDRLVNSANFVDDGTETPDVGCLANNVASAQFGTFVFQSVLLKIFDLLKSSNEEI